MKNIVPILYLALVSNVCFATNYTCSLDQKEADSNKYTNTWAGKLVVDEKKSVAADSAIIQKTGESVSLFALLEGENLKVKLKPYDGLPVISLWKDKEVLKLSQAHVDAKAGDAPDEAFAWASKDTKEIGVINQPIGLKISCIRQ